MNEAERRADPGGPELIMLSPEACRRRLGQGGVGRIALNGPGAPLIRPVNFVLQGDALVVRTGEGPLVESAGRRESAAFEIDGIDPLEHTGWSVIVEGKLSERAADAELQALPLRAWASGQRDRFLALSIDRLSGLQIPAGRGNR